MAEFVDVILNWARMCGSEHGCDDCRLRAIMGDDLCPVEPWDKTDWAAVEKAVEAWAAEHPAPVYPTWGEWLAQLHLAGLFQYENKADILECHIPADIAEKLGIEPKEETNA